jgi:hypothetical protein
VKSNYKANKDESEMFLQPDETFSSVNLYVPAEDSAEPNFISDMLETKQRLGQLLEALKAIDIPESPYGTNRKTQELLYTLANNIDEAVKPFVEDGCSKTKRGEYICLLLDLIGVKKSPSTIAAFLP